MFFPFDNGLDIGNKEKLHNYIRKGVEKGWGYNGSSNFIEVSKY